MTSSRIAVSQTWSGDRLPMSCSRTHLLRGFHIGRDKMGEAARRGVEGSDHGRRTGSVKV